MVILFAPKMFSYEILYRATQLRMTTKREQGLPIVPLFRKLSSDASRYSRDCATRIAIVL